MKCLFTKIQSNIAIWQYIAICSNTIRNMALTHIVSPLICTYHKPNIFVHIGAGMQYKLYVYNMYITVLLHYQCMLIGIHAQHYHGNIKSMDFLLSVYALLFIVTLNSVEAQTRKYYCVIPTTSSHNESCSTLAVYLLYPRQYFTSNTEVHFTTGDYHLHIILTVTNVTNLSITGDVNVTILVPQCLHTHC